MDIAKNKGLLVILCLLLLSSSNQAAAMTTIEPGSNLEVLSLDADGLAVAHGPAKPQSVKDTLLAVCVSRGYGEACAKHLLGMAWKESNFVSDARGDYNKKGIPLARGWFQIHYRLHNISANCAEDLSCSANWTLDYLETNGYPKYAKYAVQCHNGCGFENGYAASEIRHGNRLWNSDGGVEVAIK